MQMEMADERLIELRNRSHLPANPSKKSRSRPLFPQADSPWAFVPLFSKRSTVARRLICAGMSATNVAPSLGSSDGAEAPSLEEAFARYQGELLGTLCLLVGDREDAQDALQEAFIKCWRHRSQAPEVTNLKAWIFRIALNTGRDLRKAAWRKRRQPMPQDENTLASASETPELVAQRREQYARIRAAVAELREEEREVFLLRQNGDLTYQEIATALDVPTGTVKTRMRLALAKIRTALA